MNKFETLLKDAVAKGVNLSDPVALAKYLDTATSPFQPASFDQNNPSEGAEHVRNHQKDYGPVTLPERTEDGWLYQNGPFSLITDNILSMVTQGGSALLQWLPTRLITDRFERVAHLEFVTPRGFDGSQTYRDWLASLIIADCDYGPTVDWSGFEYQMEGGEWSWQSPVLKVKDFGQRDYEKSPIYTVRGDRRNMIALDNDADWGVARALIGLEQHTNYVAVYGDRNNSDMETDGVDVIIQPGYVQARRVGKGTPHYANPTVVNGAILQTPDEIVAVIRALVRRKVQFVMDRGWSMNPSDLAVVMPSGMWLYVAEAMARTGGYTGLATPSYRDFREERDRIMTSRSINVDGENFPIILDSTLGRNVTANPNSVNPISGIAGDIFVLCRRVNGEAILEQQYLDWRRFDDPGNARKFSILGGIARAGWKNINDECYQWWVKMAGRMVTRFQPLQARINNVFVETMMSNENEALNFTSPDFYAFDGRRGGQGTSLLTPL